MAYCNSGGPGLKIYAWEKIPIPFSVINKMYQARLLTKKYVASAQHVRYMQQLTSPQLRTKFIQYFEKQGHVPVKSASLVPHNDKSLLFTNAGTYTHIMNSFRPHSHKYIH